MYTQHKALVAMSPSLSLCHAVLHVMQAVCMASQTRYPPSGGVPAADPACVWHLVYDTLGQVGTAGRLRSQAPAVSLTD